ncbi:MAG: tetratricopeptide repeat protein [Elusimicrobiales bacterium]
MKRTLLLLPFLLLAGCDKSREIKLEGDLSAANQKIKALEAEVARLKETGKYHFQQGRDRLAEKKYVEAVSSFQTVVDSYPADPLVPHAKLYLAEAQKALAAELKKRAAEEAAARRAKAAKEAEEGEPIPYASFYARMGKDIAIGKRYRFTACLSPVPHCLSEHNAARDNLTCSVYNEFDDEGEYNAFAEGGKDHCGPVVAAMTYSGQIAVYRLR